MRNTYPIRIEEHSENILYYPNNISFPSKINKVAFGSLIIESKCLPNSTNKKEIIISSSLKEKLGFPNFHLPLHLFIHNEIAHLGPLVGILTSGFTTLSMRPVGNRSIFFSKLMAVKKSIGVLPFLFGEQHIQWEKGLIKGYFFNENGWETHEIPFPNVIYDRMPNRKSENRSTFKQIKDRLQQEYLIPLYNPGFFNKLEIHQILLTDPNVSTYLPETYPFQSLTQLNTLLIKHGYIYIKPINGSLGLGIHQITYDKDKNTYYSRYRDTQDKNRLCRFTNLETFFSKMFTDRQLKQLIIQQGIPLWKVDNRPVDFRVHTNKDDLGEWQVTAIAAKIAGSGSPTTHLKCGGIIKTLEEVFPDKEQQIDITEKLTTAALQLSKVLEKQMEGIIAEIGFDLGIDTNWNVWMFEANSKPGRSIFTHPKLKEFDYLTRKLSLSFSIFLTEKIITSPEELLL